jgi:hypothetical protein
MTEESSVTDNKTDRNVTNVRAFGARGDGVHDDADALEAAFASGTGLVYLPQGRYRIGRSIRVDLGQTGRIRVKGAGATIVNCGSGPALDVVGHHLGTAGPETVTKETYRLEVMPLFEGFEIVGEHPEADGVRLENTIMATFQALLIRRCRYGIHLLNRNRNVIIADCHLFDNLGLGVYLENANLHQINVYGCHIHANAGGGIKAEAGPGGIRNIQIVGNDIEYNHASGGHDVHFVCGPVGVREGTIVGNTIQATAGCGGANVCIEGHAPKGCLKGGLISITGNHISNQDVNIKITHSRGIAISGNTLIRGTKRNILITHSEHVAIGPNVLDDNPDYGGDTLGGIHLEHSRHCTVQGVVMSNPAGGEATRGGSIEAVNCSGLNITGCNLSDPHVRGISLENVCDSRVSDCVILETGEPRMRAAIAETGQSDRNMIMGNRVKRGLRADIYTVGAQTLVTGNLCTD